MKFTLLIAAFLFAADAYAQCVPNAIFNNDSSNAVCFETVGNVRNIYTNGFPDHPWGSWPSNSPVLAQDFTYHVCTFPQKANQPTSMYNATGVNNCSPYVKFGVGLNGVFFSGWGARWFVNPNTQQENLNWNVEATEMFRMDFNNSHSNSPGEYHYHGVPTVYFTDSLNIDGSAHSPLVGYAADGFPVYYKYVYTDPNSAAGGLSTFTSGHTLKPGNRPGDGITEPDGPYDGLYVEDYEYLKTNWPLDECNGRFGVTPDYPNGTYYYVITDNWPYFPRCFYGSVIDNSFRIGPNCPSSTADIDCSSQTTSIIRLSDELQISVYPNPSSSTIHIKTGNGLMHTSISQVSVYDVNGKVWYSSNEPQTTIDISALRAGNYFLQITANGLQATKKLIVK